LKQTGLGTNVADYKIIPVSHAILVNRKFTQHNRNLREISAGTELRQKKLLPVMRKLIDEMKLTNLSMSGHTQQ